MFPNRADFQLKSETNPWTIISHNTRIRKKTYINIPERVQLKATTLIYKLSDVIYELRLKCGLTTLDIELMSDRSIKLLKNYETIGRYIFLS